MRKLIRDRPWILVVLGLAVFLLMDMIFLIIALTHPQV